MRDWIIGGGWDVMTGWGRSLAIGLAATVLAGCLAVQRKPVETVAASLAIAPSVLEEAGWLRPAALYGAPPSVWDRTTEIVPKADRILVEKGLRKLTLFRNGQPWKTYHIALGFNPVGPKKRLYDGRTPEGIYTIDFKNESSKYHRSLKISYPGPQDLTWARQMQVDPGGDIFIHGLPNEDENDVAALHPYKDWTWGCIALTNDEIMELWTHVDEGTPIELRP